MKQTNLVLAPSNKAWAEAITLRLCDEPLDDIASELDVQEQNNLSAILLGCFGTARPVQLDAAPLVPDTAKDKLTRFLEANPAQMNDLIGTYVIEESYFLPVS